MVQLNGEHSRHENPLPLNVDWAKTSGGDGVLGYEAKITELFLLEASLLCWDNVTCPGPEPFAHHLNA